ncbi:CRISPR-associated helicase Cas3' [Streptomyces sp. NPDC060243]|uniref:CRISPR-associated helicase Cas3' n=1 Tax=Streptomyces sp. NPDC060243 TaxID=3347081 RepID=UPI00365C8220
MARDAADSAVCVLDVRLWGKESGLRWPYPVICHLLDVAAVFGVLWDALMDPSLREEVARELGVEVGEARAVLAFWAGLHDLGKISPPFQALVPESFRPVAADARYGAAVGAEELREFRHEAATHWALTLLLAEEGYPTAPSQLKSLAHQVAQFLGGHHGRFGAVVPKREAARGPEYRPGLGERGWDEQRRLHFRALRRVVGASAVPVGRLSAVTAVRLHGLVVLADWLASSTDWIEGLKPADGWVGTDEELDEHFVRAVAAAPKAVSEARLGRAEFPRGVAFEDIFPFRPNALQRDVAEMLPGLVGERGSGLVLVTAPTGDGKTEAALFAASVLGRAAGACGLYFALPTMATADAMFARVAGFADRAMYGERVLLLLHGSSWLSTVMDEDGARSAAPDTWLVEASAVSRPGAVRRAAAALVPRTGIRAGRATAVEADAWLRGGRLRGFAAPLGAGTIDQALTAVLPVRYNVLRLFGLSDKVLIVDEAHAYGPWMQTLMVRLLEWLGALRAPVVLLSATLTGRTATSLVDAYRRGAGFVEPSAVEPAYPGWLFVSAGTGEVTAARPVATSRSRTLDLSVHRVPWDVGDDAPVPRPGGRRATLRSALRLVAEEGGTALVCCTTVAEAQRTYRDLVAAYPELAREEGGIRLLHSRFPGLLRQEITAECEAAYGKPEAGVRARPRPASILVATQIVEQSLDFDFDLVVSDLAPLALLLQRAGRGRRHARGSEGRPGWAVREDAPPLVVLEPVDASGVTDPPRSWGSVYDHGLLIRTAVLLAGRGGAGIAIPEDVQELVDAVYAGDFTDHLEQAGRGEAAEVLRLDRLDQRREGERITEEQVAAMTGICSPGRVRGDFSKMSEGRVQVTADLLATRLGADSGRVLLEFTDEDGGVFLDEEGRLPMKDWTGASLQVARKVVARTIPVPASWLPPAVERRPLPQGWDKQPHLRDVVLLPVTRARTDEGGRCPRWIGQVGSLSIQFSRATGLERV